MRIALRDRTNKQGAQDEKTNTAKAPEMLSDKEAVISFLQDVTNRTKDFNLKYDLGKCVEILEGKENQEFTELKGALENSLIENEMLLREKCNLAMELEQIRRDLSQS